MSFLINSSGQHLVLPFYHLVADSERAHTKHLYPFISLEKFEADLDALLQYYKPITAQELKTFVLQNQPIKDNSFFLSFDDGLAEIYEFVAPILLRKGIPATFFLNTDFIDNQAMFYRMKTSLLIDYLQNHSITTSKRKNIQETSHIYNIDYQSEKDLLKVDYQSQKALDEIADILNFSFEEYQKKHPIYLTTNQIIKLQEQGFSIGSHSSSHPLYHLLSEEKQVQETLESIKILQAKFNIKEKLFAFPFTDFQVNKSFFEKIAEKVDLSFGTASLKHDSVPTNIQRVPMERCHQSAKSILKEEYLLFIMKRILAKHIIARE